MLKAKNESLVNSLSKTFVNDILNQLMTALERSYKISLALENANGN